MSTERSKVIGRVTEESGFPSQRGEDAGLSKSLVTSKRNWDMWGTFVSEVNWEKLTRET